MEQVQIGEKARIALEYLEQWCDKEIRAIQVKFWNARDEDLVPLRLRALVLNKFKEDAKIALHQGDKAMDKILKEEEVTTKS